MTAHKRNTIFFSLCARKIIGSALYVDLAIAYSMLYRKDGLEWRPSTLESAILGVTSGERSKWIHRLYQGTISSDRRYKSLQRKVRGGNLLYWKYFCLWPILFLSHVPSVEIDTALRHARGKIQQHIWLTPEQKFPKKHNNPVARISVNLKTVKSIAAFNNLSAFIVLAALAREAKNNGMNVIHYQCASQTRKLFPSVICSEPRLFIRWPLLAKYFEEMLWSPPNKRVGSIWMPITTNTLQDEVADAEKKARSDGINLPPTHIFRLVNSK